MIDPLSDEKIVDSWHKNAEPWSAAIRESQIESRTLVTNDAIVRAVLDRDPQTVLDIGCGEGWLTRALVERGVHATGVDAVPALIEEAQRQGIGDFRVASYEDIAAGKLQMRVDVAVANFALLGKESVERLLASMPGLLTPGGAVIIQTLHPAVATGDGPYQDGWRAGSWAGFSESFSDPAPWYFRTLESWRSLLAHSGFRLVETREPVHPRTGKPASVIFIADAVR
jgi:2-polyprenyl-3-methyl-5-hydroxy-6-metoxy-1,4-benzoquinol methylase